MTSSNQDDVEPESLTDVLAGAVPGAATRPAVDLRPLISSTLMDQGARPVCVPFALSHAHEANRNGARGAASNESADADHTDAADSTPDGSDDRTRDHADDHAEDLADDRAQDTALAPEAIWWRAWQLGQVSADGMLLEDAGDALAATGQPRQSVWPWDPTLGAGTQHPPTPAGTPPWHTARLSPLALAHDGVEDEVEDALAAGLPVVVVVEVTDEFDNASSQGYIDVPDIRSPAGDYHAVLVVGAADHPDRGRLLLIRNSWSEYWGAGGYGWLPIDYLIAHAVQAATVET